MREGTAQKEIQREKRNALRKQVLVNIGSVCQLFAPYVHLIMAKGGHEEE